MPDPAWPCSPPETNYLRLVGTGAAGTATTLASAAAWQALMAGAEVAFSVSSLNTAATAPDFAGLGGAASATTATGLNSALQLLAGWVQAKPPIAASAVAAYQTAVSTMVPAEVSLANRAEQASDVAVNPLVLGALTPAIVGLDLVYYGEHWPDNAAAGAAYGSALTALLPALAVPPPLAPPGASPAAPAAAAAAVAQTAGQTAAGEAMTQAAQAASLAGEGAGAPAQAAGAVGQMATQPLTGMFNATAQAVQSLTGLPGLDDLGEPSGAAMPVPGGAFGGAGGGAAPTPGGVVGASGLTGATGSGLTTYTRPNGAFAPENSGRPVGLKAGLLGATETRGPTTTGALPVSPQAGMLGQSKRPDGKEAGRHARVVLAVSRPPASPVNLP